MFNNIYRCAWRIFQDACFQPLINHPSDNTIRDSLVKNLAGINLAYLPEDVQTHLAEGG